MFWGEGDDILHKLHLSAQNIDLQTACLEILLANGADITLSDSSGDTAMQIAGVYGHKECLSVIMDYSVYHH